MMPKVDWKTPIDSFERDWQSLGPRPIAEYLGKLGRWETLVELICVDLEFRWRGVHGARPLTLAEYVDKFPDLIAVDRLPLEIIGEAYRARRRWGDRPSPEDFLNNFQIRQCEILEVLRCVDLEIAEEAESVRPAILNSRSVEMADVGMNANLLLHQDYLLKRLIGAGRSGKVYEATERLGPGKVAIKFLRKTFLKDPEMVRRFIGEAGTVARLRHDRIVGTNGLGRTPGGAYFLVMDLAEGPDLNVLIKERVIEIGEAVGWVMEIAEALEHAHERGVIHCDLKPANVLLDGRGGVRITDFGLARSPEEETVGEPGIEGTIPFMAPEQVSRCWGPIDARTDVYGLGAILFALLTGRPPWMGRRVPDLLARVVSASAVESPEVFRADLPRWLVAVCRQCLAKAPGARYQTAREVREALGSGRTV